MSDINDTGSRDIAEDVTEAAEEMILDYWLSCHDHWIMGPGCQVNLILTQQRIIASMLNLNFFFWFMVKHEEFCYDKQLYSCYDVNDDCYDCM